jgi:beta-RFAP synthase
MIVHVTAPSRLHFGLLSFGNSDGGQFGGIGAMIDHPGLQLRIADADHFVASGPHAARVREYVKRFSRYHGRDDADCRIEVISAPAEHVGLGTGTQLGLSVIAGLSKYFGWKTPTPAELAAAAGRGFRSSIGTHGFCGGGLIYEEVKPDDAIVAPLQDRTTVPEHWRWLLLRPRLEVGLYGQAEKDAFSALRSVPRETTERLRDEICKYMLPAIKTRDFDAFSESLYRYGVAAGKCFAERQSGPFASARLAKLVEAIRHLGVRGVGQSSWGPTIFALCSSTAATFELRQQLAQHAAAADTEAFVSSPNNDGAKIVAES